MDAVGDRRRAEGGVGTITVEGVLISADTEGPEPKISGPEYLPGLKRLVDELRQYDITIGVQLMHPGRQVVHGPTVAPSPVPATGPRDALVAYARRIATEHATAHGSPITRDALRQRLRVSPELAADLLTQIQTAPEPA